MKTKLPLFFLFIVSQFGFSQTEKFVQATVISEDLPLQGIEVLNLTSKRTTITDTNGKFRILAKAEDTLMFISKSHEYKTFFLKKENMEKTNLVITLTRKPEQLEEVVIYKPTLGRINYFSQEVADEINLKKAADNPKPIGVNDGSLVNSLDLVKIGKKILNLFGKKKETGKMETPEITFKELATATCTQDYFNKTLELKPEEITLFLDFCDTDPKSKIILKNSNPLTLMDFLFTKNNEFKKLATVEKKE